MDALSRRAAFSAQGLPLPRPAAAAGSKEEEIAPAAPPCFLTFAIAPPPPLPSLVLCLFAVCLRGALVNNSPAPPHCASPPPKPTSSQNGARAHALAFTIYARRTRLLCSSFWTFLGAPVCPRTHVCVLACLPPPFVPVHTHTHTHRKEPRLFLQRAVYRAHTRGVFVCALSPPPETNILFLLYGAPSSPKPTTSPFSPSLFSLGLAAEGATAPAHICLRHFAVRVVRVFATHTHTTDPPHNARTPFGQGRFSCAQTVACCCFFTGRRARLVGKFQVVFIRGRALLFLWWRRRRVGRPSPLTQVVAPPSPSSSPTLLPCARARRQYKYPLAHTPPSHTALAAPLAEPRAPPSLPCRSSSPHHHHVHTLAPRIIIHNARRTGCVCVLPRRLRRPRCRRQRLFFLTFCSKKRQHALRCPHLCVRVCLGIFAPRALSGDWRRGGDFEPPPLCLPVFVRQRRCFCGTPLFPPKTKTGQLGAVDVFFLLLQVGGSRRRGKR